MSANVPLLREWAGVIGARFTPSGVPGRASRLYICDTWKRRGTFQREDHPLLLVESMHARVLEIRPHTAVGAKPFTLDTYRLDPHPGFLVSGHLVRGPG